MPRYFPPHPYTDPAAIRAGTAKHIRFVVFRKAVFSFWGVPPSYFSSSLRRTCNTRKRRKSACNASIPAAASIRGNTAKRLPGLARFFRLPPDSGRRTPQPLPPGQPPGPSPASRFVSRPSGYSTTPSFGESEGSRWPSPSQGECWSYSRLEVPVRNFVRHITQTRSCILKHFAITTYVVFLGGRYSHTEGSHLGILHDVSVPMLLKPFAA